MNATTVLIIIACFMGTIFACWKTGEIGRATYGLNLILSWAFALVFVGTWLLLIGAMASTGNSGQATTYALGGLGAIGGAGYMNVTRSNVGFGLWMTFVQFICSVMIIVPIIYIVARRKAVDGSMGLLR